MENTKDLVRAERGGRFVCQVGGAARSSPTPGTPAAAWPRSQAYFSIPRPLNLQSPLPLPAVKRFGGFPSPCLLSSVLVGILSASSSLWKKNFRRKFFLVSRPSLSPSAPARGKGWV